MPKNGTFKLLVGPIDAPRKPKGSLGGDEVSLPTVASCPDPMGYNKTSGARKSAAKAMKYNDNEM